MVGIIIGIVMGVGGSYFIGQRYDIKPGGNRYTLVKTDRWTGRSWMNILLSSDWVKMRD